MLNELRIKATKLHESQIPETLSSGHVLALSCARGAQIVFSQIRVALQTFGAASLII
jgi:hypothetical protein